MPFIREVRRTGLKNERANITICVVCSLQSLGVCQTIILETVSIAFYFYMINWFDVQMFAIVVVLFFFGFCSACRRRCCCCRWRWLQFYTICILIRSIETLDYIVESMALIEVLIRNDSYNDDGDSTTKVAKKNNKITITRRTLKKLSSVIIRVMARHVCFKMTITTEYNECVSII